MYLFKIFVPFVTILIFIDMNIFLVYNFYVLIYFHRYEYILTREHNSVDRTLYYICRRPKFEFRSFHLSTLKVEFLATKLFNKKKNMIPHV
jgi:hypothetical protein